MVNRHTQEAYGPGDLVRLYPSYPLAPAAYGVRRLGKILAERDRLKAQYAVLVRCATPGALSHWRGAHQVLQAVSEKIQISKLAHVQPLHLYEIRRLRRKAPSEWSLWVERTEAKSGTSSKCSMVWASITGEGGTTFCSGSPATRSWRRLKRLSPGGGTSRRRCGQRSGTPPGREGGGLKRWRGEATASTCGGGLGGLTLFTKGSATWSGSGEVSTDKRPSSWQP